MPALVSFELFLILCFVCSIDGQFHQFPGWGTVSNGLESPHDAVIDYTTGDIFVSMYSGQRLDVLLGGQLPKTTIYKPTSNPKLIGLQLMRRTCSLSQQTINGVFFSEDAPSNAIKFLPLPLPINPSAATVGPTVGVRAVGLRHPAYLTQTHHSMQLYVAEYNNLDIGAQVSHWEVKNSDGGLQHIRSIKVLGAIGVAITRDDNVLFVTSMTSNKVIKVTPMLSTTFTRSDAFPHTLNSPNKILLHPLHSDADDFILYFAKMNAGTIIRYVSVNQLFEEFVTVSAVNGKRPRGVEFFSNGTVILIAEDGLKVSCCAEAFNPFTTLAAYRNSSDCLPTTPKEFRGVGITDHTTDIAIDFNTGNVFLAMHGGKHVDVLLGGTFPRITIYTTSILGLQFMNRQCVGSTQFIYGMFLTDYDNDKMKFLPLPLPLNPTQSKVQPTVKPVATDLLNPHYFTQTYNSLQLYVAENDNAKPTARVSHWAVGRPADGDVLPILHRIRNFDNVGDCQGVTVTSDDNLLLVSAFKAAKIYKVTPLLTGSPIVTSLNFPLVSGPQQILLNPLHSRKEDYILYVGNYVKGNVLQYDSATGIGKVLITGSEALGQRLHSIALAASGDIYIPTENGVKRSCCVEAFDPFTTLAAYRNGSDCAPLPLTSYPGFTSSSYTTENPHDVAIDYTNGNIFVGLGRGNRLIVLLGGYLPKVTVYSASSGFLGLLLLHRSCAITNLMIYGLFMTRQSSGSIEFVPLPLPTDVTSVEATVRKVAAGLLLPRLLTATYNSMQMYVAENNDGNSGAGVSHWAVSRPANGDSVPTLRLIRRIGSIGYPHGVAITRDDNILFVSSNLNHKVYKVTPLLNATTNFSALIFMLPIASPRGLLLHPLHNKPTDYVLYVANLNGRNIIRYDSKIESDEVFIKVSSLGQGYRPHAVFFASNGSVIITAEDGLKVSCCVEAFAAFTKLAPYRNGSDCLPTSPVQYPGWDPVDILVENALDTVIDSNTGNIYVSLYQGKRLVVLRGGNLPNIMIYSSASGVVGLQLMHRVCTSSKLNVSGIFFTEGSSGLIKFLPLPLPLNPTSSNVEPTIQTVASGLLQPLWFTQTYNSMQLYVAENNYGEVSAHVSQWAISGPGSSVPGLELIRNIDNVGYPRGVAITRDDNMLFVSSNVDSKMYKVTSLLSATPITIDMVFTETLNWPQQLVLHPLHNKNDDYHLYVVNAGKGSILLYDSNSELDEVFIDVNSTSGYRPHGIAFASNGSIIIAAQDGLKTSCCVESFNPVTDLPHASCAEKEESFSATTTVAVTATFPDHLQLQSKTTTRKRLATSTLASLANFLSVTKAQTSEGNLESSMNESISVTLVVNASLVHTGSDSPVGNISEPPSTAVPQQHSENLPFVSLGIEPTAAKAVTASASTAVTATSVVSSPQVATSGVRIGMLSGPVSCRYIEELEDPDLLQFAFPLSLDFGDPNSPTKVWTGSALVTAVLLVVFCGITSLVSLANLSSTTLLELLASIEATLLGYFLPSIVEAALVISREHSHVGEMIVGFSSAMVSFALLIAFSYHIARTYAVAVKVEQLRDPVSNTPKINFQNTSEESKFVERYGPYFDRCRDPDKLLTRCSYFVDVFVSCLVGAASGFRAKSGCTGLAIFLLLLCLANLIFNLWLRPTRYKLDLIFLIIFSVVMVVQSVLALLIVVTDVSLSETLLKVYDVVLFIAYIGFMVQLVVTAFWSVAVRQRRKVRRQTSEQMQRAAASVLNVPLVPMGNSVEDDDVTPSVVSNPLQQSSNSP